MFKNTADQRVSFLALKRADGTDATGLVFNTDYAIGVSVDGAAQAPGGGTAAEIGKGIYRYAPTQAETNGDHVEFSFSGAIIITQLVQIYPIDVALYKADVSNLPTTSQVPTFGTQFKRASAPGTLANEIFETQTDEQAP